MNFYLENGYVDMKRIIQLPYPFIFLVHGRGTGKTFGACDYALNEMPEGEKFFYLRRSQLEADLVGNTEFSPFDPVIKVKNRQPVYVGALPSVKNIRGVWNGVIDENGKLQPQGETIGYIGALNTISGIRGFSGVDVTLLIYDEFIPEATARPIKAEGEAVLQCYETINRNREITGGKPLKMLFLSNANKLSSPIFAAFGIMGYVDKMVRNGQEVCILPDRGIALLKLRDSPISKRKAQTALYKAAQSEKFKSMSIDNAFDTSSYLYVQQEPINEYRLLCSFCDVYIYKHKAKTWYYVSRHKSGVLKQEYINEPFSRKKFRKEQTVLLNAWINGNISFQDYYCKQVLTEVLTK